MPVRGAGDATVAQRYQFGIREIHNIPVKRAQLRLTLTYEFHPKFRAGIEVNPLDEDVGPIANWRALDETENRPAIIFGTSSARIGTERGRAYYVTASKNLEKQISLPLSPYVGIAYSDGEDEEIQYLGGLNIRYLDELSSTHFYDGRNLQHHLDWTFTGRQRIGGLLVEQEGSHFVGVTYGIGFDIGPGLAVY